MAKTDDILSFSFIEELAAFNFLKLANDFESIIICDLTFFHRCLVSDFTRHACGRIQTLYLFSFSSAIVFAFDDFICLRMQKGNLLCV